MPLTPRRGYFGGGWRWRRRRGGEFPCASIPGRGERRRRPPFPGKRRGPDPGVGAAAGRGGGRGPRWSGGRQAAVVVVGMGASGTCIFQLGPSGSWGFGGGGEGGTAFRVPHPPFLLSQASLKCSRACPPPTLSWSRGILTLIMLLSPKMCTSACSPSSTLRAFTPPFCVWCVCMCLWGRLSGKNLQQIESRSHHEADSFIAYF